LRAFPAVPSDPLARCDLIVALARCLISSGAVAAARARALEAAALARAAADGHRLAAAALAFGTEIRIAVVDPTLVGLLEEALAREVGHPRYLWRPRLARAMRAVMSGRLDDAERLRAEAAALGARTDDPNFPVVHAMQAFGLALDRGEAEEMRAVGERLMQIMAVFPGISAWRPVMTALALVRVGLLDEARAEWARLPDDHPLLLGESLMMMLAGEVAAALGDRRRA